MNESLPAFPVEDAREITVADLDALIILYFDTLQIDKVRAEAALSVVNKAILSIEAKLVTSLKALNRKEYKHSRGTVKISNKWRVNGPQTDADKAALFDWLKERGIYDKYATVNVASLNSLYMAEWEALKKTDPEAALCFSMPGIGERKLFETISKNKGKGDLDE